MAYTSSAVCYSLSRYIETETECYGNGKGYAIYIVKASRDEAVSVCVCVIDSQFNIIFTYLE